MPVTNLKSINAPDPEGDGTHRLAYYEWGSGDNTVICVHGLTRNARDFDYLAAALSDNYRVICIDVAGRGLSEHLKNPAWYNYKTYADDTAFLLKALNIECVNWVGTSMGGIIGMAFSALHPKITIRRMVLNDIGSRIPAKGLSRLAAYVGTAMEFPDFATYEQGMRALLAGFAIKTPEHWQHMLKHSAEATLQGRYRLRYDPAISNMFKDANGALLQIEDADLSKLWEVVKCDTLILRGEESDILLEDTAREMTTLRNNVKLIEYSNVGHAPNLMESQQIEDVAKFLF